MGLQNPGAVTHTKEEKSSLSMNLGGEERKGGARKQQNGEEKID